MVVVCPLRFEARQLGQAGLGDDVRIECCGPGARAMTNWASALSNTDQPVVLAGLAGSLHEDHRQGAARIVDRVIDADSGAEFRSSFLGFCRGSAGDGRPVACSATSRGRVVSDPADRQGLRDRTGADLVDMESVAFARFASEADWRWGIVRGISDDLTTTMPQGIEQWVDARGRTRIWKAAISLAMRPGQIEAARCLRRVSVEAMLRVADTIRLLLESEPPAF